MNVSRHILVLDTSILESINMNRRGVVIFLMHCPLQEFFMVIFFSVNLANALCCLAKSWMMHCTVYIYFTLMMHFALLAF